MGSSSLQQQSEAGGQYDGGGIEPAVTIRRLHDPSGDLEYWLSKSPADRIAAVETLRRQVQGTSVDGGPRLQRVCRDVRRTRWFALANSSA